ncbi:MAG: SdrD B-like domain-containing protein, partial [Thiothrix sp.]
SVVISQNAIYANGNLGIDLANNGVTVNDANDTDAGANNLLNFPLLSMVSILNNDMTLTGCAPAGATIELFEADVSVGGKATPGDNKQGKNKDYGEGQTYLSSFTEGSTTDTNSGDCAIATDADGNDQTGLKAFTVVISKPASAAVGDTLTATATVAGTGTSEFSPAIVAIEPPGLSGKVFEDVNYGGGSGRPLATAGVAGVNGARVELYNAAGALIDATTTATDGTYTFIGIIPGDYHVRVVNSTAKSSRTGSTGAERGVQTYRTNGSSPVTNEVGGRNPASVDAAANTTNQTLNTATFQLSGGGQVQTVQPVTVSGSSANGVNFGFNFSTIVNTNDSGQGSLRQFILNSNLLGQSSLNQDLPTSIKSSYGSGKEVSIFMVPASQLTNGVAILKPQTTLPASAKANIAFDARTQTLSIGNTNTGATGENLTVGIQGLTVAPVDNPEVAIDCSAIPNVVGSPEYCMTISGTQANVHGFAFYGANTGTLTELSAALRITSTASATIGHNLFGTMPDGTEPAWPQQNRRIGLLVEGTSAVSGNYFGYSGYGAVFSGSNNINSTFVGNQMNLNGPNMEKDALNGLEDGGSVAIWERAQVIIEGNDIKNSRGMNSGGNGNTGGNVQTGNLIEATNAGKAHIRNNTLTNGFIANVGVYDGSSNVIVEYNIISRARGTGLSPTGSGVLVNALGANPDPVYISRNSIFANNGLGIDLDPGKQSQTGNRVDKNDANDADSGPNDLLNFPYITAAHLEYGQPILAGCSPPGADIEFFEADVSPGGTAAPDINKFGNAKDYGEGQTYLATLVEGSASDTDNTTCDHMPDTDGNKNQGMEAFHFAIPIPPSIVAGDKITTTGTLPGVGTSEFSLVSDGVVHISYNLSGTVFEDVNYGGGSGRPYGTAGTVGRNDALVELYDANTGDLVDSTRTENNGVHDGAYLFADIGVGNYYVRVVNATVSSSRSGSNGSELGVQTYRSNGSTATTTEIGGRHPAETDASAQQGSSELDFTTFRFKRGPMNGDYVQTIEKVDLLATDVTGVDFGFNFDTIVNTNDTGQGSLRQIITNANLLGDEASLALTGRVAGKEYLIPQLPTTDTGYNANTHYWSISLKDSLPDITGPVVLDGSLQSGFVAMPVIELSGNSAGTDVNGLTLATGSDGSTIRKLAINQFHGVAVHINGSGGHTLQANHIGINPAGATGRGNMAGGILLDYASNNMIGGTANGTGNIIAFNNGPGVSVRTGSGQNAILGNSIYSNATGLGIDLNADGVTSNDPNDVDTGPNGLLNYPEVQNNSFGANGTKIITYDFDLDVAAGDYRLEFFVSDNRDPSSFGEGQYFIGYKDIAHPGSGVLNFKGTFNANQPVPQGALITATLTAKSGGSFLSTSEFSGIRAGIPTSVCTDLINGTDANMVIDENATTITLLEAKDSHGDPITYVISGGADSAYFAISPPPTGATMDCSTIKFINSSVVITKTLPADSETRAITPPGFQPNPGNFEAPMDAGGDNVYNLQITATDSSGNKYVRNLSVRVMDVNETPYITTAPDISLLEDGTATVKTLSAMDPDANSTLTYSISGGVDASQFEVSPSSGILKFRAIPDYDAPMDANRDNLYEVEVSITDAGGLGSSKLFKVTVLNDAADDGVLLSAKALLQGAYDSNSKLMADDLRRLGLLPALQPYGKAPFNHNGSETVSSLVLEATANNAAVDWVLLELRTSPTSIMAQRALILQRDGDLVDPQTGSTTLHFAHVKAGSYYISLRHRNHLGIISASPVTLDNTNRIINFASASVAVKGENARYTAGNLAMLWAGDINANNTLTASGPENDANILVSSIITETSNTDANTNYIMNGYQLTDLNMDGKTLFTGPNNDASLLMGNIILHPSNGNLAANYIVQGGLPH